MSSESEPMDGIDPFANESESLEIGGLTFENQTDRVSVYGSIDITRDKRRLDAARKIATLFNAIAGRLASDDLLETIPPPQDIDTVKNPFE
jgi:hypothetical protein